MVGLHWMVRMKRWAQNPPSWGRVKFVFAIVFACILLYAYEYFYGWPDFLSVNNNGRVRAPKL